MAAVSPACVDQVGRLFPFPLPPDIAHWAAAWCGANVPAWIVALGVSAWIEAVSEKRGTPEALRRKDVMSELQAEIEGHNRELSVKVLAKRLYGSAISLETWFVYLDQLKGLNPPLSKDEFIAVFQSYAQGKINSREDLNTEVHRIRALAPPRPTVPGL